MNRTIEYMIKKEEDGLRIEQFLKRRGYSSKNLTAIKRMPKSVLVNGEHFYMRQELHESDHLAIVISETECSEKVPPTEIPLNIVYEDEDIIVINKPAGMPIHPSLNNYTNSMANALAYYYEQQGKPFIFRCSNRLITEDLPTLDLPAKAISGKRFLGKSLGDAAEIKNSTF